MNRDEAVHCYGLALALVGDPDVAGDLFMDAKDEADLLRRANWWRFQQGLAQAPASPELPALASDQVEHALHLAGRAGARRKAKLIWRGADPGAKVPVCNGLGTLAGPPGVESE